jgi:hypothetical protein
MNENNSLDDDLSMGVLNRFISEETIFEQEFYPKDYWNYDNLALGDYHSTDSEAREIKQTLLPKGILEPMNLNEQLAYGKFKSNCQHYNRSESEILMLFNLTSGILMFTNSLMNTDKECVEVKASSVEADVKIYNNFNENYILINGHYWKKFNGFINLSNSSHPVGKFAPQCQRCANYVVSSGLITSYIIANMGGRHYQCISEMCIYCFWIHRKLQLKTTSKLLLTNEFLKYAHSPENIKNIIHANSIFNRDLSNNLVFPEYNIGVKSYDSSKMYWLFRSKEYPKNPSRAMLSFDGISDWDTSTVYEIRSIVRYPESQTRKRHYDEAFISEDDIYEDSTSQPVSNDLGLDNQQTLDRDNLKKNVNTRKKTVRSRITKKKTSHKETPRKLYETRSSYKKKSKN